MCAENNKHDEQIWHKRRMFSLLHLIVVCDFLSYSSSWAAISCSILIPGPVLPNIMVAQLRLQSEPDLLGISGWKLIHPESSRLVIVLGFVCGCSIIPGYPWRVPLQSLFLGLIIIIWRRHRRQIRKCYANQMILVAIILWPAKPNHLMRIIHQMYEAHKCDKENIKVHGLYG